MQCLLFWKCLIMSQQLLEPNGLALYQQEQVQPVPTKNRLNLYSARSTHQQIEIVCVINW